MKGLHSKEVFIRWYLVTLWFRNGDMATKPKPYLTIQVLCVQFNTINLNYVHVLKKILEMCIKNKQANIYHDRF